jgi:hypothetical protein
LSLAKSRVSLTVISPAAIIFAIEHQDMSKAFTKETDGDDDEELGLPALPSGARNYITPVGYARLRAELFTLMDDERPKVVEIVHWAESDRHRGAAGELSKGPLSGCIALCAQLGQDQARPWFLLVCRSALITEGVRLR